MSVYKLDKTEWVKQAVTSILKQDFSEYIFFIVLDGEVHEDILTFLVELERCESRVVLIQNKNNVGLSQSMNTVVDTVYKYDPLYFFRMDADDIAEPDRLTKQINFLENNPNVSILGSSLIEINETGKKVGKRSLPVTHSEIYRVFPKRCAINHPTVAFRFDVFKAGWRYDESLKNTQDYFFWTDLMAAGYIFANLPEALLQFRRVNDFYKRRGLGKSINEFKARFYAMKKLKRYSIGNIIYAFSVLFLRIMPSKVVKIAYKIDRYFLNKLVKHE